MELNKKPKITAKSLRRVGRGHGSGRGKTSGRGTKGQNARTKAPLFFEGGALPLTKRLPFLRGRGRNTVNFKHAIEVRLAELNKLPSKTNVDVEALIKYAIIDSKFRKNGVKIIDSGEIKNALIVSVPVTRGAKVKIEKAGGSISA
ncbi:MAG TPA: 50S ribosomal protein L15 [Patescibacteria group bacterium]|nr:50S ribosomal protein L15 [Patescibacteria group bacterium]